jgi:hypothetical protein
MPSGRSLSCTNIRVELFITRIGTYNSRSVNISGLSLDVETELRINGLGEAFMKTLLNNPVIGLCRDFLRAAFQLVLRRKNPTWPDESAATTLFI